MGSREFDDGETFEAQQEAWRAVIDQHFRALERSEKVYRTFLCYSLSAFVVPPWSLSIYMQLCNFIQFIFHISYLSSFLHLLL